LRPYEVMVIFDITTDPSAIQGLVDRTVDLIKTHGGNPGAIDRWGKRQFAYEVKDAKEGYYVVIGFGGVNETVSEVDRMLGLADEVIRHKVIRLPERVASAATAAESAA
jgi:small subunit ribosomal protein S6